MSEDISDIEFALNLMRHMYNPCADETGNSDETRENYIRIARAALPKVKLPVRRLLESAIEDCEPVKKYFPRLKDCV
jgi:hypothetical protein